MYKELCLLKRAAVQLSGVQGNFKLLAEMTEAEIQYIYELTYKYGYITSDVRQGIGLEDNVNVERMRLEEELKPALSDGLAELENTFTDWIGFHKRDGWIEAMTTSSGGDIYTVIQQLFSWRVPFQPILYEFVAQNTSEGTAEQLKQFYPGEASLLSTYKDVFDDNLPQFLNQAYDLYLERFPGLEDKIAWAEIVHQDIIAAINSDLNTQIITFQSGLTTAHQTGTMADYLLAVPQGEGQAILDKISSGPNKATWEREISKILGRPAGSAPRPVESIPGMATTKPIEETMNKSAQVLTGPPAAVNKNPASESRGCFMCGWTSDFSDMAADKETDRCPKCGALLKKNDFAINPAIGDMFDMQPTRSAQEVPPGKNAEDLLKSVQQALSDQGMDQSLIQKVVDQISQSYAPGTTMPKEQLGPNAPKGPEQNVSQDTIAPVVVQPLQENKMIKPLKPLPRMARAIRLLSVWSEPERTTFGKDYEPPTMAEVADEEEPGATTMTKEELRGQIAEALGIEPEDLVGTPVKEAVGQLGDYADVNISWGSIAHLLNEVF